MSWWEHALVWWLFVNMAYLAWHLRPGRDSDRECDQ